MHLVKILGSGSVGGKDPFTVSTKVESLVYSNVTKTIYVTDGTLIQGYTWDGEKLNMKKLGPMGVISKSGVVFHCLALGLSDSKTEDILYVSIVKKEGKECIKKVLRLSGSSLEKENALKLDHIKDECLCWKIASNPSRKMLLVHPSLSCYIYVHSLGKLVETINLTESNIAREISEFSLVGDKLIVGISWSQKVTAYDLVMDETQFGVDSSQKWGPIPSHWGFFGALRHIPNPNDIHIITKTGPTEVSAFKYGENCNDPIHTVDLKKGLFPLEAVVHNKHMGSLATLLLIGKNEDGYLSAQEVKQKRRPLPPDPSSESNKQPLPPDPSSGSNKQPLPPDPSSGSNKQPLPPYPSSGSNKQPLPPDPSSGSNKTSQSGNLSKNDATSPDPSTKLHGDQTKHEDPKPRSFPCTIL